MGRVENGMAPQGEGGGSSRQFWCLLWINGVGLGLDHSFKELEKIVHVAFQCELKLDV